MFLSIKSLKVLPIRFLLLFVCNENSLATLSFRVMTGLFQFQYLQPIITQYFIDNKSEIWLLFLIAHSKR